MDECLDPSICSELSPGCEDVIGSFFCHPVMINTTVAPMNILDITLIDILIEFELDTVLLISDDTVLVDEIYYLRPEYLQFNSSVHKFNIQNSSFKTLHQGNKLMISAAISPG